MVEDEIGQLATNVPTGLADSEWVVAIVRDVTERYARDKALRVELAALKGGTSV